MRKQHYVACVVLVAALGAIVHAGSRVETRKVTAEAIGLEVKKPLKTSFGRVRIARREGTYLTLKLTCPDKALLGIDEQACRIDRIRDDQNTDLMQPGEGQVWESWIASPVLVGDDGHECVFELCAPRTPAGGAKSITVRADLSLKCGLDLRTEQQAGVPLKNGAKITVGPSPLEIKAVQDGGWGGDKMTVILAGTGSDERIKAITLLGPDGKEIEYGVVAKDYASFAGTTSYQLTLGLSRAVQAVTVKVSYYQKMEKIRVPLDMTVGVGF